MVQITIKPQNLSGNLVIETQITIMNLFQKLKETYRNQKLNVSEIVTEFTDNKLIIYTYQSHQQNNSNKSVGSSEITLYLNINCNKENKQIIKTFAKTTTIADIKELALVEYDLLFEQDCNIQIKLFGQPLIQQNLDQTTLQSMFLHNFQTFDINLKSQQKFRKENDLLNELRNQKDMHQKLQKNIITIFKNIKNRVDIILNHTLDELIQLINKLGEIIFQAENNIQNLKQQYLNEDTIFPLSICQIILKVDQVNTFISQIEHLTNTYTVEALEISKELFFRYQNIKQLEVQQNVTLLQILQQEKIDQVSQKSKLSFSNKLINQIDLNEIIKNLVDHIVYIDRCKIEIKQLGNSYQAWIFQ